MKRALRRLGGEGGFGIIELAIAMVMLNVGILALVAGFNSGAVTLARSSRIANATVIADTFLERYRGYRNCQIYLDANAPGGIPTTGAYATDQAYPKSTDPGYNATYPQVTRNYPLNGQIPATCPMDSGGAWPGGMSTSQQASVTAHNTAYTGPDLRTYVVDVYMVAVPVTGGGNQKKVTVVVRDSSSAATPTLARESSTFDPFDAP